MVERTGVLAYKSIHLVVHVSQLKKALGPFNKPSAPVLSDMFEWVTELADVQGIEKILRQNTGKLFWHGRKGLSEYETTWETVDYFKKQFPTFHLQDKVDLEVYFITI